VKWLAVVALVVACTHAAAPKPAPPESAAQLLAHVAATYRGLPAYGDRGTTVAIAGAHEKTITFETSFARPDRFRFQVDDGTIHVAWSASPRVRAWWSVDRDVVYERRDLATALESMQMSSLDTDELVAPLLGLVAGPAITDLANPLIVDIQPIDGHPCVHVRGGHAELWIDRDSYLIRRYTISGPAGAIAYHFEPRTSVADADFRPPYSAHDAKLVTYAVPAWLGLGFAAKSARVTMAIAGGPAAKAGITVGDELVSVDGKPVASVEDVRAAIAPRRIGEQVPVVVRRAGQTIDLAIELAEKPDDAQLQHDHLIGKPAPAFDLPGIDGTRVTLAALAGHVVVLDFWATWCGPCALELPELVGLAAKHSEARFVGISDEDEPAIRAYMASHNFTYPVARDDADAANRAYLVQALPTIIIIDKTGVVREVATGAGDTARLEAVIKQLE
jgi:cytochrome c biogenesis protein CcmG, thiol:disulfide interchange protein DsbE